MPRTVRIYGLNEFGLDLRKLRELGVTPVRLHAYVRHPEQNRLFRFRPDERLRRIKQAYDQRTKEALAEWPSEDVQVLRSRTRCYGLTGTVRAQDVRKLLQVKQLDSVWIEKVGDERRRARPPEDLRWFAVRAIFAIQVEDQTAGLQDYEERIVVVKAHGFDDAVRRLRKEFRLYAAPYLNPRGEMVRWSFEKVIDVYDTGEEEISESGTEVFSNIRSRRIRPAHVWHPHRKRRGA